MKKINVYLDMDGTIADLYGEKNWLADLLAEKTDPFENAKPMTTENVLFSFFPKENYNIKILSMTPKNATKEYCDRVEKVKNEWLNKYFPNLTERIYVPFGYNKNLKRISLQLFYKKRDEASLGSLDIDGNMLTNSLHGEYIYGNEVNNEIKSSLRFNKYYRNSDSIHLNFKIYNNDIGVYFRKLYVFATELLIEGNTKNLFGFQYIEFEKLFNVENSAIPELILAVPFDNITKSNSEENKYFIEYFIYDIVYLALSFVDIQLRLNLYNSLFQNPHHSSNNGK